MSINITFIFDGIIIILFIITTESVLLCCGKDLQSRCTLLFYYFRLFPFSLLPSFLLFVRSFPSFLPSFLSTFLPSFLPFYLPSFLPTSLSWLLSWLLPSFLPFFLPSLHDSYPSFASFFLPSSLPPSLPFLTASPPFISSYISYSPNDIFLSSYCFFYFHFLQGTDDVSFAILFVFIIWDYIPTTLLVITITSKSLGKYKSATNNCNVHI